MPIRPENKKRYPANWKQIRADILTRAKNKCEFCGVKNKSFIIYEDNFPIDRILPMDWNYPIIDKMPKEWDATFEDGSTFHYRKAQVVLTIAHLDQTPENCDYNNLRALCQKCHNTLDAPFRAEHRKNKKT